MQTNSPFTKLEFAYETFVIRVEKDKEQTWNLIVFQTVTDSDEEFWSEPEKKLKNKENLFRADEFTLHKLKIFLIKSSS